MTTERTPDAVDAMLAATRALLEKSKADKAKAEEADPEETPSAFEDKLRRIMDASSVTFEGEE